MKWIGLRDSAAGLLSAGGLDQPAAGPLRPQDVLACGSLMIDCTITPSLTTQTLMSFTAQDDWQTGLTLTLDPLGLLCLTQTQGADKRAYTLHTGLQGRAALATIVFTWHAPDRHAMLSIEVPDTAELRFMTDHGPFPMSMLDIMRLMADRNRCYMSPGVRFAAVSDAMMPIGPLPSLDAATPVTTPKGPVALCDIRPGQIVVAADGQLAQVRWVGGLTLPARARFAPLRVRAPFYGAQQDIVCAPCQQIHFRSTEVEYLFATHTVSARAGDLLDGINPVPLAGKKTATYWQIVLDRSVPIAVHGVPCATLDVAPMLADAALRSLSVLRDLPVELLPHAQPSDVQRLQAFETRSLCELRVA